MFIKLRMQALINGKEGIDVEGIKQTLIGIDISKEYCEMATKRIEKYNEQNLF